MKKALALMLLLMAGKAWAPPIEQEYEFSYCGWNPRLPVTDQCFRTFDEAKEFVLEDPTPNKRRRFLEPLPEGTQVSNGGGERAGVYFRTVGVPPEPDFVTWYTGSTNQGTGAGGIAIIVPDTSELITELLPYDQFAGRYSESAIHDGIHEKDHVSSGTTTGEFRRGPGGAKRVDTTLERVQVHFNFAVQDAPRLYTAAREWGIVKQSRAWCPVGMNLFSNGLCYNDEEGRIRIFTHLSQESPCTEHPCVPGTGAKELHEKDFQWGAWAFQRNYTSLPNLARTAPMGEKWRHTFQAYIPPLTGYEGNFHHIDEYGRLELYTRINTTLFQANNRIGTRLEYASSDPERRWRRVTGGTRIEYFSSAGDLTRIELTDSMQDSVDLQYCRATDFDTGACQAKDELWKVTDARGRVLEFVYAPGHYTGSGTSSVYHPARLLGVRSAGQWLAEYEHDGAGRLLSASYPDLQSRTYHYGETSLLCKLGDGTTIAACDPAKFALFVTGITDEEGQRLSNYTYDNRGRVTSSTWAGGAYPETLKYLGLYVREVGLPDGTLRKLTYVRLGGFVRLKESDYGGAKTTYVYDAFGKLTSKFDRRGTESRYEYTSNRPTATTEAYGLPEQRRTEKAWDVGAAQVGELLIKDSTGTPQGKSTRTFNGRSQVTTSTVADPATLASRTTTFSYCESTDVAAPNSTCPILGLLKSIDGPRNDVADTTTFDYYPLTDESGCASTGPCHRKGDLWKVTNALGHVTETLRYDVQGRVKASKDANGVVTELTYHARGWLHSRTVKGASTGEDAITEYDYDANGQVERITRPDGDWTDFEYDTAHRLVAVEDAAGNRIEYTVNAAGERTAETTKDASNNVTRSLSREFDALGRLDVSRDAYANATDFGYDANDNQTSVEDPLGFETRQEFDPLNRLKRTLQDYGGLNVETKYAYDALNRLTKVTDPKGLGTIYAYNGFGDLTQLTSPDTGVTQYTYDSAGNRATQTDARNITATYSYDALNRLTAIAYPTSTLDMAYYYDEADGITGCSGSFPKGRMTRMTDESGSTTYCYDRRGNLTRKTQITGSVTLQVSNSYTLGDRLASMTYPSGGVLTYTRDSLGQVETMTWNDGVATSLVAGTDYAPFGPIERIDFDGSADLTFTHDQNYAVDAIGGSALSLDLEWDVRGNLVELVNVTPSKARGYDYDPLGRLTSVEDGNAAVLEAFTYDATGNRLSKQTGGITQSYGYPSITHRLTSVGGVSRSYDSMGSLIDRGDGWTFEYNDAQRLDAVKMSGILQSEAAYNGRGERTLRMTSANAKAFAYDEAGRLVAERDSTVGKEYLWLDDRVVGIVASGGAYAGELMSVHTDHLGTPRAIEDNGDVRWLWELEGPVFGSGLATPDPDADGTAIELNLRLPGQYADPDGLYYNYFRDYEPGTGRYIESDPSGLDGGLTTYGYANQAPHIYVDPFGLEGFGPWWDADRLRNQSQRLPQCEARAYVDFLSDVVPGISDLLDLADSLSNGRDAADLIGNFSTVGGAVSYAMGLSRGNLNRLNQLDRQNRNNRERDRLRREIDADRGLRRGFRMAGAGGMLLGAGIAGYRLQDDLCKCD